MSKTILIVDDEIESRAMLRTYLEKNGFTVVEASDGYDGLQKALQQRPDLVLMDMAMPMMDGVNSTRSMRKSERLSDVPILCMTAFPNFYDSRALDAGCNGVVHKPVDIGELKLILDQYVS